MTNQWKNNLFLKIVVAIPSYNYMSNMKNDFKKEIPKNKLLSEGLTN